RCQVELARMDEADPRHPALLARSRRCGALTGPRRLPMFDHVPGGRVMFRRGLIAGAEFAADAFLTLDSRQCGPVPLEQLRLLPPKSPVPLESTQLGRELAERSELAKLHTLAIGVGWDVGQLRPLLTRCPHLTGLRALAVEEMVRWEEELAPELARIVQ